MFTLVPRITIQDRTMLWKVNEFSLIYLPTCLTTYVSVIFCFLASSKLPHGSQAALASGLVLNKETCSSFRIFALALQSVWNALAPDTHLSILSSHSHFLSDVTSAERSSLTISSITALALPAAALLPLPPRFIFLHSTYCQAKSYLTLCDSLDCSPPGSSVHGILRARILERIAMPSSRGSLWARTQTGVSHIAGGFLTSWATREAHCQAIVYCKYICLFIFCLCH